MQAGEAQVVAVVEALRPRTSFGRQLWQHAKQKKLGTLGGALLLALILVAVFAPWIAPYGPLERIPGARMIPPGKQFLLGTDAVGRDLLSRLIHGARVSLGVGFASVFLAVAMGTTIGLVSGYFVGKLDMIVQRFMDAFMSVPTLLLAIVIVAVLGQSLFNTILAIAIAFSTHQQRTVRGAVLSTKENDYVVAARAIGARTPRILVRHILPNVLAVILIQISVSLGGAILTESSLSFLGLGVPPPYPTWGGMLAQEGRTYMLQSPWLAIWPGVTVSLAVLSVNLFGDALRDAWDPRLRGG